MSTIMDRNQITNIQSSSKEISDGNRKYKFLIESSDFEKELQYELNEPAQESPHTYSLHHGEKTVIIIFIKNLSSIITIFKTLFRLISSK